MASQNKAVRIGPTAITATTTTNLVNPPAQPSTTGSSSRAIGAQAPRLRTLARSPGRRSAVRAKAVTTVSDAPLVNVVITAVEI